MMASRSSAHSEIETSSPPDVRARRRLETGSLVDAVSRRRWRVRFDRHGSRPRDELVQDHTQREDIHPRVRGVAAQLFGARIGARRALEERMRRGAHLETRPRKCLRDAEVQQLRGAFGVDQDIGRLEIAVNDHVAVRERDGVAHLPHQAKPIEDREGAAFAIDRHRYAVDVLA